MLHLTMLRNSIYLEASNTVNFFHKMQLHFFLKNSFYKNIKAWIAEKKRTMLRTLEALNFSKINVFVEFFKRSVKISQI